MSSNFDQVIAKVLFYFTINSSIIASEGFIDSVMFILNPTFKEAGATIENGKIKNVVKLNVYLNDIAALSIVDKYMLSYLTGHLPARTPLGGINYGNKGFVISMDAVVELPR